MDLFRGTEGKGPLMLYSDFVWASVLPISAVLSACNAFYL